MPIDFNDAKRQHDTRLDDFLSEEEASDWLRTHVMEWAPQLFPQARLDRDTGQLRMADITGRAPRKQGSCVVCLRGDHAGSWHEFDGNKGGGPISTVGERLGLSGDELFAEIKRMMGSRPASTGAGLGKNPRKDNSAEINHTIARAVPIAGTLAEAYFHARGITEIPNCPDLAFNSNCTHWGRKTGEPALIARFRYPNGAATGGIHRIYLKCDGSGHDGKKMLGPVDGGLIMLSQIGPEGALSVGEGIETTLAGMQIYGIPGWATASAHNMKKFGDFIAEHGRDRIQRLDILADRGKAGEEAAQHVARAAKGAGIDVTIRLPVGDDDFADDLLNARGRSENTLPIDMDASPPANRGGRPKKEPPDDPAQQYRSEDAAGSGAIQIGGGMLPYAAVEGERRIIAQAFPVYQMEGRLVRIANGPVAVAIDHEKQIVEAKRTLSISNVMMRGFLNEAAPWEKYDSRAGCHVPTNVTEDIAQLILDRDGYWQFPPLTMLINVPALRSDNSLLKTPGYDPQTGLYFDPVGIEFPEIPDRPTRDDAIRAVQALIEPIREVPFPKVGQQRDYSVAVSAILSIVHRHALDTVPAHVIDAVAARTGKGLTTNYEAIVGTGSPAPAVLATRNPEETEKALIAMLRSGATLVSLDNLVHPIGESGVINQILTEPVINARILGQTETFRARNRHVILMNGNHVVIEDDLVHRVVRATLDAEVEDPQFRTFKTENPLVVARRDRGQLVAAALTILRWHRQCGCPDHGEPPLGGFETWDRQVRGAIIALDVGDPVASQAGVKKTDYRRNNHTRLLHAWFGVAPKDWSGKCTTPMTARELAEYAMRGTYTAEPLYPELRAIMFELFDDKRNGINVRVVGMALSKIAKQIMGGLRVEEAGENASKVMQWIVRQVSGN